MVWGRYESQQGVRGRVEFPNEVSDAISDLTVEEDKYILKQTRAVILGRLDFCL